MLQPSQYRLTSTGPWVSGTGFSPRIDHFTQKERLILKFAFSPPSFWNRGPTLIVTDPSGMKTPTARGEQLSGETVALGLVSPGTAVGGS
jgi:hypothetical protein